MLNLQCCGGGKRLSFCNGVQRYDDFLNWKNFFRRFLVGNVKIRRFLFLMAVFYQPCGPKIAAFSRLDCLVRELAEKILIDLVANKKLIIFAIQFEIWN